MKYALAVNEVGKSIDENTTQILELIDAASKNGADVVIFPEAAISGLYNIDSPEHDYKLCFHDNSEILSVISKKAKDLSMYISLGFLEKENNQIFDSAICFNPLGLKISKYRRCSSGWHGNKVNPEIYKEGNEIVEFIIGKRKHSFLICGDLFDDNLINSINAMNVDIVIVPLARSFKDDRNIQIEWEQNELKFYAEQCKKTKALCLMVNYLSNDINNGYYFGGAHVIDDGQIIKSMQVGRTGILYYDI